MIYSIIAIILESFSSLFKSIDTFLNTRELTIGAILMGLAPFIVILNRITKEKEKRERAKRIEKRQKEIEEEQLYIHSDIRDIMKKMGVVSTWISPRIGSIHVDPQNSKRLRSLLQVVTILRRKKIMQKWKSRKLWLAVFGALFPVLNVELGINLDPNVVFSVIAVIISGIAGLAHVDAKRAQAVVTALKTSVVIDPNATYKDYFPTIKEVHEKVNKFLELAKTNDVNVLAVYPHLLELLTSYEHPEPVVVIVEDKVAS